MIQAFIHVQGTGCRLNGHLLLLPALWTITACSTAPQPTQNEPLPPSENATPQVAQLLLDGNRLLGEHRRTAAILKYEDTVKIQPTLTEAHDNLGVALYKKGSVSAASPFFIEAADLAPGHPLIWYAPPLRKMARLSQAHQHRHQMVILDISIDPRQTSFVCPNIGKVPHEHQQG